MADLKSKSVIIFKGLLFLLMIALSSGAVFCLAPDWRTLILLAVLVWASARFYYFLFYVLHSYVDERYKYAGIIALMKSMAQNRKADNMQGATGVSEKERHNRSGPSDEHELAGKPPESGSVRTLLRRQTWIDLAMAWYSIRNIPYLIARRPAFVTVMTVLIWGSMLGTYVALRVVGERGNPGRLAGFIVGSLFIDAFFLMAVSEGDHQHWRHGRSIASEWMALRRERKRQIRGK